ncbi:hypothetical protein LINPERHAP1_LOCUS42137 [Linum perenne]
MTSNTPPGPPPAAAGAPPAGAGSLPAGAGSLPAGAGFSVNNLLIGVISIG